MEEWRGIASSSKLRIRLMILPYSYQSFFDFPYSTRSTTSRVLKVAHIWQEVIFVNIPYSSSMNQREIAQEIECLDIPWLPWIATTLHDTLPDANVPCQNIFRIFNLSPAVHQATTRFELPTATLNSRKLFQHLKVKNSYRGPITLKMFTVCSRATVKLDGD